MDVGSIGWLDGWSRIGLVDRMVGWDGWIRRVGRMVIGSAHAATRTAAHRAPHFAARAHLTHAHHLPRTRTAHLRAHAPLHLPHRARAPAHAHARTCCTHATTRTHTPHTFSPRTHTHATRTHLLRARARAHLRARTHAAHTRTHAAHCTHATRTPHRARCAPHHTTPPRRRARTRARTRLHAPATHAHARTAAHYAAAAHHTACHCVFACRYYAFLLPRTPRTHAARQRHLRGAALLPRSRARRACFVNGVPLAQRWRARLRQYQRRARRLSRADDRRSRRHSCMRNMPAACRIPRLIYRRWRSP